MARFLLISLLVTLLDQLSKSWVVQHFIEHEVVEVWPVFNLTLAYNAGAAFSFLAGAGGWQQYLFVGPGPDRVAGAGRVAGASRCLAPAGGPGAEPDPGRGGR